MFIEQIASFSTLLSDITMALVRPMDGYHGPRYSTMLAHLATASGEMPNPMTSTPQNSQEFVKFALSVNSVLFSQSTRIRSAIQPGMQLRKVQSALFHLARYHIDDRIYELYELKSVRNQFQQVSPGTFRIPGLEFASNNLITSCRMAEGVVIPAHTTYRLSDRSYLITSNNNVVFNIPNYVANTSLTWDRITNYLCFNAGEMTLKIMVDAPIVRVLDAQILEGAKASLKGGDAVEFIAQRWSACRLNFLETHVHRNDEDIRIRPIPDADTVTKWLHVVESASPIIRESRGNIFNPFDANNLS